MLFVFAVSRFDSCSESLINSFRVVFKDEFKMFYFYFYETEPNVPSDQFSQSANAGEQ
jgi:hypothetical protein